MYKTKLKKRCETQLSRGAEKCQKSFANAYSECLDKMPYLINYMTCWPMKVDAFCDVGSSLADLSSICDPSSVVDADFGNDYVKLKEIEGILMSNESNIDITYDTADPRELQIVKSMNQTNKAIQKEVNEKIKVLDYFYFLIHKLMGLVFFFIIYGNFKINLINNM